MTVGAEQAVVINAELVVWAKRLKSGGAEGVIDLNWTAGRWAARACCVSEQKDGPKEAQDSAVSHESSGVGEAVGEAQLYLRGAGGSRIMSITAEFGHRSPVKPA